MCLEFFTHAMQILTENFFPYSLQRYHTVEMPDIVKKHFMKIIQIIKMNVCS